MARPRKVGEDVSRQAKVMRDRYMLAIYKEDAARLTHIVSELWEKKLTSEDASDKGRPTMAEVVKYVLDCHFKGKGEK